MESINQHFTKKQMQKYYFILKYTNKKKDICQISELKLAHVIYFL